MGVVLGIFSGRKKGEKKGKPPPKEVMVVQILPIKLWWEDNMLNALLEALQEASGKIMTSRLVGRLGGAFFVVMCLVSGIALLITGMYLVDPKGFDERLSQVLVERPVEAVSEETAEEEEEAVGEEAEEEIELEEAAEE